MKPFKRVPEVITVLNNTGRTKICNVCNGSGIVLDRVNGLLRRVKCKANKCDNGRVPIYEMLKVKNYASN